MNHADELAVDIQEVQIIELLQHEVAGIEQDPAAPMATDGGMEALEAGAIVQVLAGVDLIAEVHAMGVAHLQDRQPAPRQLLERGLDQTVRALREGEQVGPGERTGEGAHAVQAQALRGLGGQLDALHRPRAARGRIAMQVRGSEAVAQGVVGRVHCHQLAEDMRGEFADHQPVASQHRDHVIAVLLAVRGFLHIEQAFVPGRDLQGLEALAGRPTGNRGQVVERGLVCTELGQVQAGAFDGAHRMSPYYLSSDKE
ncbi:hypothetical protein D3C71_1379320 [compost metagenome]